MDNTTVKLNALRQQPQVISPATITAIAWDTILTSVSPLAPFTNGTSFMFPMDGWYLVTFGVDWEENPTGVRSLWPQLNGLESPSFLPGLVTQNAVISDRTRQSSMFQGRFLAGDTITILVLQTNSAPQVSLTISGSDFQYGSYIQVVRVPD
jgi:hypothetical protein